MNGRDFFASPNGVDPERPDDLLSPGAEKVFELADPYIAAWSLRERDPGKSLEIARGIIADRPGTDQSVPWAHNVVGFILSKIPHKDEEAIAEVRKAIELDPRNADSHNNLGLALSYQGMTAEAIVEYRRAIELDPRDALPHRNLAIVLRDLGKIDEADAEDQKAKELGAKHPD